MNGVYWCWCLYANTTSIEHIGTFRLLHQNKIQGLWRFPGGLILLLFFFPLLVRNTNNAQNNTMIDFEKVNYDSFRIVNKTCFDNGRYLQTNWNMCKCFLGRGTGNGLQQFLIPKASLNKLFNVSDSSLISSYEV